MMDASSPPGTGSTGGLAGGLIGVSPAVRELARQLERFAPTDLPVLIEGEPGTGKGLVALALHRLGPRAARPFVRVDCPGLGEEVFEAVLFGAAPAAEGLAVAAAGGTLYFDEVGDLPPGSQDKLARFLDSRLVRPVGAPRPRPIDLRIVSSTRRELRSEVQHGRFRPDLYYRLRGALLRVPNLRDRRDDVPLLAAHFLERSVERSGRRVSGLSAAALERLQAHSWEGNVRELLGAVERAVLDTPEGREVRAEALGLDRPAGAPVPDGVRLREYRHEQERTMVLEALAQTRWNVSAAARTLGISRVGLSKKIKTLGLRRPAPSRR